jgi:hypothetical protein
MDIFHTKRHPTSVTKRGKLAQKLIRALSIIWLSLGTFSRNWCMLEKFGNKSYTEFLIIWWKFSSWYCVTDRLVDGLKSSPHQPSYFVKDEEQYIGIDFMPLPKQNTNIWTVLYAPRLGTNCVTSHHTLSACRCHVTNSCSLMVLSWLRLHGFLTRCSPNPAVCLLGSAGNERQIKYIGYLLN